MNALKIADKAAKDAFDAYLVQVRATASFGVPEIVIEAARKAFVDAGGRGEIVVKGHGNPTHPVCSVSVKRAAK